MGTRIHLALAILVLAFAALNMVALATLYAETSNRMTVFAARYVAGDGDDEWSKGAVLAVENGVPCLYVVGNEWRRLMIAKLCLDGVKWVTTLGDPDKGDLGDWPEFRDVYLTPLYVLAVGYTDKAVGGRDVVVAAFDRFLGKPVWVKVFGDPNAEDRGYGIVADALYVYVVGYTKGMGADGRDLFVARLELASGKLLELIRVDGLGDKDSEYGVDVALHHDKLFVVGMTNVGGDYDILMLEFDTNPLTGLKLIAAYTYGTGKVYEIAAYSNFKNSGGAVAIDGDVAYVLGQMKDPKAGKTSTIVIALDLRNYRVLWSLRIRNATDISVEFYPDQIAVGRDRIYVVGHGWYWPGLWKEGGFVAVIGKDGVVEDLVLVVDRELEVGVGAHAVATYSDGMREYAYVVLDYPLKDVSRIAFLSKLNQVAVEPYRAELKPFNASMSNVSVEVRDLVTKVAHPTYTEPVNGKSNLLLAELSLPLPLERTITVSSVKTSTVTKTVLRTTTTTRTATVEKTVVSTVAKTFVTTEKITKTVSTTLVRLTPTTVTTKVTERVTEWTTAIGLGIVLLILGFVGGFFAARRR